MLGRKIHDDRRPSFRSVSTHCCCLPHHDRLEDVELEVAVRASDRYGYVVSHHLPRQSSSVAASQAIERSQNVKLHNNKQK